MPDLTGPPGTLCSPSAQHAVRQAKVLGDNIVRVLHGRTPSAYIHKHVGSVASLGLHKGVAQVYGVKLRGFPAWFMHRTYHVSRVPTLNRKIRVVLDWTLALFFKRDVVSLGSLQRPREEFSEASAMSLLAVTVIGHDRPGIIADATSALAELGGNLEDSTMTILRGHFAMVLLVSTTAPLDEVEAELATLTGDGTLEVSVRELPRGAGGRADRM